MSAINGIIYARKGSTWTHRQMPITHRTLAAHLGLRVSSSSQFFGSSSPCVLLPFAAAWAFGHLLTTALSTDRPSLAATPAARGHGPASMAYGRRVRCHPLSYLAPIAAAKAHDIAKMTYPKVHARLRPLSRIARRSADLEAKPAPITGSRRARLRNPNSRG